MEIHNLDQGSEIWKDFRRTRISATDISVLMGVNPYKSPFQLWQEKLGLREPDSENEAMRRGKELEPVALKQFCEITGMTLHPAVVTHDEYPWAMCSLDGLAPDRSFIIEIKCMGKKNHDEAMAGDVKPLYMYQMQWQMFVTGLSECYYFVYSEESHRGMPIARDQELIDDMIVKANEFLERLRTITPPPYTDLDYDDKTDDEHWNSLMASYALYDQMEKDGKLGKEHVKYCLIEAANGRNVKGSRSKFTKVTTIGRIDYTKIPEIQGLDLEPFRGKPVESYRITLNKD